MVDDDLTETAARDYSGLEPCPSLEEIAAIPYRYPVFRIEPVP